MLCAEFPRVQSIRNPRNLNYAEATNRLWSRSESDWTLLLNPDTVCHFTDLLTLPRKWDADIRCAAVAPQLRYFDGRIQPSCRRFPDSRTVWREGWSTLTGTPSIWKMGDFDHRTSRAVPQPMFSALWIRRSAWQKVGELDLRYPLFFNDVDWCRRALAAGHEIQFDSSVAVLHRHGGSTSRQPMRKLWLSTTAFGCYLLNSPMSIISRTIGMLGLLLSLLARFPGAMFAGRRT